MTEPSPSSASPWELPPPILFNTWKHHAGALRQRLADTRATGAAALGVLPEQLLVMGTELMDLYTGTLTPAEIGARVREALRTEDRLTWAQYHPWIEQNGGYRMLTFPEDQSQWVLRAGAEDDRYVHLHPGRWTPETRRVRANVLKTAIMVLAHTAVHGGDPRDVAVINKVRQQYLGLAPIRELLGDQGLGVILDLFGRPDRD
jgi:hypothetical protein